MKVRDFTAFTMSDAQMLIDQLARQEALAEKARRNRDRSGRRRAEDESTRLRRKLLAQSNPSPLYLYTAATGAVSSDDFRTEWQIQSMNLDALDALKKWHVDVLYSEYWGKSEIDLSLLPAYSFALHFAFTLAQPYLSKDDISFYIIDNPIVRDKVFGLPMVRPSSWKGNLRAALWQLDHRHDGKTYQDECVQRMFGETRDDEDSRSGRLVFFPTFFTQTSLEIINPHDRVRRVGKNPILFESVRIGARGDFILLYIPFDRVGQDEAETRCQVARDLTPLAEGLRAMFTVYGFSAKRSSGFGLAQDTFARDDQGKPQAYLRLKGAKGLRPDSFKGLCQAAEKLVMELNDRAGGAQ